MNTNSSNIFKSFFLYTIILVQISCGPKWKESGEENIKTITNQGGQTLGYSTESGVKILTVDMI